MLYCMFLAVTSVSRYHVEVNKEGLLLNACCSLWLGATDTLPSARSRWYK